jgi:hypothetical protein
MPKNQKPPTLLKAGGLVLEMELIPLVRPEDGITLPRRLDRRWYKSVMGSEHHDLCTLPRLSFKSQI